jgi:hypothetical protein
MTSLKIYLILGALIVAMGTGFKIYYDYAQEKMILLAASVEKANDQIKEQEKTFNEYKTTIATQLEGLKILEERQLAVESETGELAKMLARHRLDQLSAGKPGLIERKANAATKKVFAEIEEISKPIKKEEKESEGEQ